MPNCTTTTIIDSHSVLLPMKTLALILFTLTSALSNAQHKIKTYWEKTDNSYLLLADNGEYCPLSIKVDFTVSNVNIPGGNNQIYVLEPMKARQIVATLPIANKTKATKVSAKTLVNYGDHHRNDVDSNYAYDLPYTTSKTFNIHQGYDGKFSHQNENSLDFEMPIGTEIVAVRDGIVINVVQNNKLTCPKEECKKYNNSVLLYHPDGSFSEYAHIKFNGATVKIGDQVAQGQLIAYSGNTGWSTGPHLHLVIFQQKLEKRITLKTKFKTDNGNQSEILVEGKQYIKNY